MTEINYYRITDWNESFHDLNQYLSFEAGFYISEAEAAIFSGRVIDSQGQELFRSQALSRLNTEILQRYQ
jgi:hypothetical protein